MGTTILSSIALLNLTGNITGGYHPDRNIRRLQQKKGSNLIHLRYLEQILMLNMED